MKLRLPFQGESRTPRPPEPARRLCEASRGNISSPGPLAPPGHPARRGCAGAMATPLLRASHTDFEYRTHSSYGSIDATRFEHDALLPATPAANPLLSDAALALQAGMALAEPRERGRRVRPRQAGPGAPCRLLGRHRARSLSSCHRDDALPAASDKSRVPAPGLSPVARRRGLRTRSLQPCGGDSNPPHAPTAEEEPPPHAETRQRFARDAAPCAACSGLATRPDPAARWRRRVQCASIGHMRAP
jgi:hypothetical protein